MKRYQLKKMMRVLMGLLVFGVAVAQQFTCFEREDATGTLPFIGASETYRGDEVPWMVNLARDTQGTPFCGGSLITPDTVLTAAHCLREGDVPGQPSLNFVVRRAAPDGSPFGPERRVRAVTVHPDYEADPRDVSASDIALIRLDRAFDVSQNRLPRLLSPDQADNWAQAGDCVWAKGWGITRVGSTEAADVVQGGDLVIWSDDVCREVWQAYFFDGSICAGYPQGGVGTCSGDSGGPLIVRGGPTEYIQVGVVSFGNVVCAVPNTPTVFVRVSAFHDWIFATAASLP